MDIFVQNYIMLNIILFGKPGSGKGTQAEFIKEKYKLVHISTGEIFRKNIKNKTDLGKLAQKYMNNGDLVPDNVTIGMLKTEVDSNINSKGFLFDGFPRTIPQAQAICDAGIEIDFVIEMTVDDEEIVSRLSGRRVHENSGRIYHLKNNPPMNEGLDDETGEPLFQRADDREGTVRNRLSVYHELTKPLVNFYISLATTDNEAPIFASVDGLGSLSDVQRRLLKSLN